MKEKILVDATIFSQPSRKSPVIKDCLAGDELELGKFKKNQNELWVEVTLPDGSKGFLTANTRRERCRVAHGTHSGGRHEDAGAISGSVHLL